MTTGGEERTDPDQAAGTADLKSQLRDMLAEDFLKRLAESKHVSEQQCKRLYGLLADGSISGPNIVKALTVDEGSTTDG
jgi:hypothetical protein